MGSIFSPVFPGIIQVIQQHILHTMIKVASFMFHIGLPVHHSHSVSSHVMSLPQKKPL